MSNLIPEQRVNKLGHTVTKHVRSGARSAASNVKIPAPSASVRSAKPLKLRPRQLEQVQREFSNFKYQADKAFGYNGTTHIFVASDQEMYEVMSVASLGNAFALLWRGVRSADDARQHMRELGIQSSIIDESALMHELLKRRVPPEETADALCALVLERSDKSAAEFHDSPHRADVIEFLSYAGLKGQRSLNYVRDDILAGAINMSDIREISVSRLKHPDRLYCLRETLRDRAAGKIDFPLEDLKTVMDRASEQGINYGTFRDLLPLLKHYGIEGINKMENLNAFIGTYRGWEKGYPEEVNRDEMDRAYYHAILEDGTEYGAVERSGRYWGETFPKEVALLRNAGVDVDQAITLMNEGKNAQQIIAMLAGVELALADGWI